MSTSSSNAEKPGAVGAAGPAVVGGGFVVGSVGALDPQAETVINATASNTLCLDLFTIFSYLLSLSFRRTRSKSSAERVVEAIGRKHNYGATFSSQNPSEGHRGRHIAALAVEAEASGPAVRRSVSRRATSFG
jgi:hypothetical protein